MVQVDVGGGAVVSDDMHHLAGRSGATEDVVADVDVEILKSVVEQETLVVERLLHLQQGVAVTHGAELIKCGALGKIFCSGGPIATPGSEAMLSHNQAIRHHFTLQNSHIRQ